VWKEATEAMTALVYSIHKKAFIAGKCTLYMYIKKAMALMYDGAGVPNQSPQHIYIKYIKCELQWALKVYSAQKVYSVPLSMQFYGT
jgi:hypothetical protein